MGEELGSSPEKKLEGLLLLLRLACLRSGRCRCGRTWARNRGWRRCRWSSRRWRGCRRGGLIQAGPCFQSCCFHIGRVLEELDTSFHLVGDRDPVGLLVDI